MKRINNVVVILSVSGLLLLFAGQAGGAFFFDDFETDTSAEYIYTDTFGSGGNFDISGGTLNVNPAGGNTADVFHKTAQLEAGEVVSVFAPESNPRDFYLTVSTITRGPNIGTEDGIRFCVPDSANFRARIYRDGVHESIYYATADAAKDLTLYIYRDTATEYRVGYDAGEGIIVLDTITINETASATGLYIGVEAYHMDTRAFDNLKISFTVTPDPADGEDNVPVDKTLGWTIGGSGIPDALYDVYLGTDPNESDPDWYGNNKEADQISSTTYTHDLDFLYETTYYWRVDVYEPNTGGDYTVHTGSRWTFTTAPPTPVIISNPVSVTVAEGDTAEFIIVGSKVDTYTWYKESDPETEILSGPDANSLIISPVQQTDEDYYYCVLENEAGSEQSESARLMTKRLVGQWKLNGDLTDSVGTRDGDIADPNFVADSVDGGGSYQFYGDGRFIQIADSTEFFSFYPQGFTVNAWVKTQQTGWQCLVTKRDDTVTPNLGFNLYATADYNTSDMTMRELGTAEGTGLVNVADGQWHMITGTYDPDTGIVELIIDGRVDGQAGPYTKTLTPDTMPLIFGVSSLGGASSLDGLMDDVRIWNYPLDHITIGVEYTDMVGGTVCIDDVGLEYDYDGNCIVDLADFATFAASWLNCREVPTCIQ